MNSTSRRAIEMRNKREAARIIKNIYGNSSASSSTSVTSDLVELCGSDSVSINDSSSDCEYINNADVNNDSNESLMQKLQEMQLEMKKRDEDMKLEFKKRDDENQKFMKTLTEQLVALRAEVRDLKSVHSVEEAKLSLLTMLPFVSLDALNDFDAKLLSDKEMRNQVKQLICRIGGNDMASFLRMAVRTLISDELAIHLTWRGTADKPSIQKFNIFNIIKDACQSKHQAASIFEINKVCQQHFLHAKDRVNKRKKLN